MKFYRLKTKTWSIERAVFLIAGTFILTGLLLAFYVSIYFLFFVGLVGLMQIIFALTGFCPMAILLKNLGFNGLS